MFLKKLMGSTMFLQAAVSPAATILAYHEWKGEVQPSHSKIHAPER